MWLMSAWVHNKPGNHRNIGHLRLPDSVMILWGAIWIPPSFMNSSRALREKQSNRVSEKSDYLRKNSDFHSTKPPFMWVFFLCHGVFSQSRHCNKHYFMIFQMTYRKYTQISASILSFSFQTFLCNTLL